VEAVTLNLDGDCLLLSGAERQRRERLPAGSTLRVESGSGVLLWRAGRRTGRSVDHLFVSPVDPATTVTWQETPYPGELRVDAGDGGLTLVNVVELETYLRGVVPWEIGRPGREAQAALAAQAVAARTYSVSHLGEREQLGFDMWAGVTDQVYRGLHGTDAQCDRAIAMTAGLVLRHDGREIEAYYCSTCGGTTSSVHEVWPRPARPYLVSHADADDLGEPLCAGSPHFVWSTAWSAGDLQRTLQTTLPEYLAWVAASPARGRWTGEVFRPVRAGADGNSPGRLLDLSIEQRTVSGRIARLSIATEAGVYTVRGDRVRWVLVPAEGRFSILKSAAFALDLERDGAGNLVRVTATGRGFGHGIGMCQTGALAMARRGHGYQRILSHYYPGARLERMWSR
ncbi:SpoIID/LytB domain-containing protein, partial [bacterium]|nr:SpoIID/LytB domain-containing protein [bacterium]